MQSVTLTAVLLRGVDRPTVDACRLVTQQEAEASAGESLGPGKGRGAQPRGASGECEYQNGETGTSVTVSVHWATDAGSATKLYDRYRGSAPQPVQDVPGLGDRACFSPLLQQLYVLKGDALVGVQLVQVSLTNADVLTGLSHLATLALSRL